MDALEDELEAIEAIFPEISIQRLSKRAQLSYELPESCGAVLRLETLEGYPADGGVRIDIDGSQGALRRKDTRSAIVKELEALSVERSGGERLLELLSRAEDLVATETTAPQAEQAAPPPRLGRRGVWFHHIISKAKRADLKSLASEFEVGGYFKIGWPGVLICEGEEKNVDEFLRLVHRWRWQGMVVRATEVDQVDDIDRSRVLPSKLLELDQSAMSDLASKCEEAGLQHLFRSSVNLEPK